MELPPAEPPPEVAAHALEKALAEIQTSDQARRVIRDLQRRAAGRTVGQIPQRVPRAGVISANAIAHAANSAPDGGSAPAIFAATAEQMAAAPPVEGSPMDLGIMRATNPGVAEAGAPELEPNRRRLRQALIKELAPLRAIDTALFLEINELPHPHWLNLLMRGLTIAMKRADAVSIGLLLAALKNPERGSKAMADVLPSLWLSTFIIETPVKNFFRRKRPFIEVVRATVIGRRPSSFSFPSGHSAAAFAGATLLRRHYPRWTGAFYLLAVMVGFSRVYLGAHYPGDVATGAVGGTLVAEASRMLLAKPVGRSVPFLQSVLQGVLGGCGGSREAGRTPL